MYGSDPEQPLSVSQCTHEIKNLFETHFSGVWIKGEISGLRPASSGHYYFSLKDEQAVISAIIWRSKALRLGVQDLSEGVEVTVFGRIDVYAPRGGYQIIIESLIRGSTGTLYTRFLHLKEKLESEGLFDRRREDEVPLFPRALGVITSATGAAVRDILKVLNRRWPSLPVYIYPAQVQGTAAAATLIRGLEVLSHRPVPECFGDPVDCIILTRGGGSIEDLWCFNDETLARAIVNSPRPVISAVGHERDFTIADFAACKRSATPSAAAEICIPEHRSIAATVQNYIRRITSWWHNTHERHLNSLNHMTVRHLSRSLLAGIDSKLLHLSTQHEKLEKWITKRYAVYRERWLRAHERLQVLSPQSILDRGFSITYDTHGCIIKNAAAVAPESPISVRCAVGTLNARVTKVIQKEKK